MTDVTQWLDKLGLGQYARAFIDNAIDYSLLVELTDTDLEKLGVQQLGHRKHLLKAIGDLRDGADPTAPATPSRDQPELDGNAERRQLTVMFCDMVGSTELSARLDAEDYREVIRAYQDACAGVIARFDGYVARFMGDGVLAYFGWPRAHEDDAARAINAGLGVVDAIAGLSAVNGAAEPVAVRIGIATGPVVIGDIIGEGAAQEAAVTGETPNLAARLQQLAEANTVVITQSTQALAGGLFDYESLGTQEIKGIEGAPEVWRVVGERRVESRFAAAHRQQLTPLIGREEELELLSRRWRRAADGEGQVVLLSGEPGIGKSRLTRALQDTLTDTPHLRVLLQCSPHHTSSTLYPVISQLELAAGFVAGDSAAMRLDKLATALAPAGQPADEIMPLFASLLSIPAADQYPLPRLTPQQQKDRTLAALIQQLEGLSAQQPVLFILEDAHWIDPTTQELIELTIERLRELPVLLVITYRPEFAAPWVGDDHVSLLALNRLTRRDRARMAQALLGDALPEEVLTQIAERSDGIPLFVEELTRAAREAGVGGTIPATLHDALEARFDRSPAVRDVAQIGAAIGREFAYGLLAQVSALSAADLDAALDDLAGSGLIFARGALPDATYTFKHALIQDTAYDSMVRSKRHDTHKHVAETLQSLHPEIAETEPETLAHHYTEANQLEHAIDWWTKAGQAASARSANPESITLLERGLKLVSELPPTEQRDRRELAAQRLLVGPLISVKGQYSAELEKAINRILDLCEALDISDQMVPALRAKCIQLMMRGQHEPASVVALDLLKRVESSTDKSALFAGHLMVAISQFFLGRVSEAQGHVDFVLANFNRNQQSHELVTYGYDSGATAEGYNAIISWTLGWPDQSQAASERSIAQALALDHVGTIGPVLSWGGFQYQATSRDIAGLKATSEHFRELSSKHYSPIWTTIGMLSDAVAASMTQPTWETADALLQALEHYESLTSNAMFYPIDWASYLAENYCAIDDPEKALEAIDRGFAFADSSGEHWSDSDLFRMRGVALALRDGANGNDEAETWLRRAIEDARSRQAKSFELRAALSLSRLLRDQGRHALARETLAPVYDCTEGFDTPDLIDAKALLDEFS
jgi:class 3 adenylate cyclase/tetratricopeptide (TPR) repeat protein